MKKLIIQIYKEENTILIDSDDVHPSSISQNVGEYLQEGFPKKSEDDSDSPANS
jgi:hypothetical protein